MPGHLENRSKNSWTIVIDMGRDPQTKKRKRIYQAFKGTKKEAEREMNKLVAAAENGTYIEPAKYTFGEYLLQWLRDYGSLNLSPTTLRRYTLIVNRVNTYVGTIPLGKLRPMHLQEFYRRLIEDGRQDKKGGPLAPASLIYYHRVIHRILEAAFKQELVAKNVADQVELPFGRDVREEDERIEVFTEAEIANLLGAAKGRPYFAILFLAIRTGLRRGELLGLKWGDVDLGAGTITVKRALAYTPEKGIFFKTPKNKKSRRTIDVSREVFDVLRQHKKRQLEEKFQLGDAYEDNNLVFCQPGGKPMHPDSISSWFPKFIEKAGLPRRHFHCLRHTHATLLLKAGEDIKLISERLGHSTIRITYDIYSHVMPGQQKRAAEKLEELLGRRKQERSARVKPRKKRHENESELS